MCIGNSKPFNVLFIVSDDLRPEIGGAYGKDDVLYTPNLEAFMDKSFTFTQAYTQYPLCAPTRASFLTGLRPDTTKIWSIGPYFRDTMVNNTGKTVITLPQYFKDYGNYLTIGAGKVFHCGTASGGPSSSEGGADMPYSWSEPYWFCDQFYNGTAQSTAAQSWPNGTGCVQSDECIQCMTDAGCITENGKPSYCMANCDDDCYPDGLVADQALKYFKRVSELNDDQPWFIGLGLKRPHLGFFAPTKYFNMYNPNDIKIAEHREPINSPPWASDNNGEMSSMQDVTGNHTYIYKYEWNNTIYNVTEISDDYHAILRRGYYASVTFMDSQFGKIMQGLYQYNLWNNTIIVFTGDHGWQLGEQGNWCKLTNYELSARVPLIIRIPDGTSDKAINEGGYTNYNVEQLDMFPTIIDASQLGFNQEILNQLQGKSLLDVIKGNKPDFPNVAYTQQNRVVNGDIYMGLSMRTDIWRYTEWHPFVGGNNMSEPIIYWDIDKGIELYNHSSSINENDGNSFEYYNLAYQSNMTNIVNQLSQQLRNTWDVNQQKWSIKYQYKSNQNLLKNKLKFIS